MIAKFILILGFFLAVTFGVIGYLSLIKETKFDSNVWKSFRGECSPEKYGMTADLLKSKILLGLDFKQVEELLGSEVAHRDSDRLEFCAGPDMRFTLNRPVHIVLQFESHESGVSRVKTVFLEGPP
jgi:hypothetical protein